MVIVEKIGLTRIYYTIRLNKVYEGWKSCLKSDWLYIYIYEE